ncbi:lipopolysaccharide heptosyltransferase II [bacterium]|nr:lipopolysaccharide heptosyltransferase II [candidate division CSSED10-310 bacterium]
MIPDTGTVLVRVPNWIGDTVMATGGLAMLRRVRPAVTLAVLAKPWVTSVIAHHPAVDQILHHNPRHFPRRIVDFCDTCCRIRRLAPNAGLLLHKNFESALLFFMSGVPIRIGRPTDSRGPLLTQRITLDSDILTGHQVHHYHTIVAKAAACAPGNDPPRVYVSDSDRSAAQQVIDRLPGSGPIIPLAPGAAHGAAKCWPPVRVAGWIDRAVRRWDARVVLLGGVRESALSERISSMTQQPVFTLAGGYPLLTQAAVIAQAGICIANDSGLMHLAAALPGVRVVALFGPTIPRETAPYGAGHIVIHHPPACWPCKHRSCPEDHDCMMGISAEQVIDAVETILQCG